MNRKCRAALFLICLFASAGSMLGQATTAQINGRIADPSGAAVPDARIVITNVETALKRESVSNEQGNYAAPLLPPGNYTINIFKEGFRPVTRSGMTLTVDQTVRLDVILEVGSVTEAVNVTAAAPLLEQETSALGQVVDNEKVTSIPINGRSPFRLIQLTPTVVSLPSSYGQFRDIPVNTQDDAAFSINGARAYTNELMIDGFPSTAGIGNEMTTIPNIDSTQEFKIQTSNLSAEWGRIGGGVINVSTRSGTNQLHGALYEFLRNDILNANEFFNKRGGKSTPEFRLNQFGYALGAPIVIPKLYNGKDRTFFFTDYQGSRWRQGVVFQGTMPTDFQRQGDFSHTLTQTGQPILIYDPVTTRANPDRPGTFLRTPFPGNIIPRNRMDPVALKLMPFYPEPNTVSSSPAQVNNYISNAPNGIDQANFAGRIDHALSQNWRTFARLSDGRTTLTFGDTYCITNDYCNPASPTNGKVIVYNYSGGLSNTITLSPRTVLDVRYGFARFHWIRTGRGLGFDQTQVGMPPSLVGQLSVPYFPIQSVQGFSALGGGSLVDKADTTQSILSSLSHAAGRHNLKTGIDFRIRRVNLFQLASPGGTYSYTQAMTTGPDPNVVTTTGGVGAASFLLGAPSSGSVNSAAGVAMQSFYYAGYVQDDIRLSTRLTLNAGLRYETESPYSERYNQLNYFDFSLASPVRNAAFPNLTGGLVFADSKNPTVYNWNKNGFAPRAGFAYTVTRSTVLRGGSGLFIVPLGLTDVVAGFSPNSGFSSTTPMVATLDGLTPYRFLNNPYPTGLTAPVRNSQGASTYLGQAIGVWQRDVPLPYTLHWNLDLQQSLPGGILVDAAYTGSRGVHQNQLREFNALAPQNLALGTALQTLVANPFYPNIPTGALSQATVQRRQLLLPYPQFTSVQLQNDGWGNSVYHALAVKVEKRTRNGLTFLVAYTLEKLIADVRNMQGFDSNNGAFFNSTPQNWYDLRSERSVSEIDTGQALSFSYVAELPFGKNRHFLSGAHGVLGKLVGGWQLSGVLTYHGGYPLAMSATIPNGGNRPNSTGVNASLPGGRSRNDEISKWFNTAAFTQPAAFTYGNVARTLGSVRGPNFIIWDTSMQKNTQLGEKLKLQFRFESFNTLNRPNFDQPNSTVGNLQFGTISATVLSPRVCQAAMKLVF
jgi:hypothetical protein